MTLSLIVAMERNRGIGFKGIIPWLGKVPADMKHFKSCTVGHPVIMGRTTYLSIGRPLPGRTNIVLTYADEPALSDVIMCNSIEQALEQCAVLPGNDEIFIIGGGSIYAQTLQLADRVYITLIDSSFGADTFFPEIDPHQWKLIEESNVSKDEKNEFGMTFLVYEKEKE